MRNALELDLDQLESHVVLWMLLRLERPEALLLALDLLQLGSAPSLQQLARGGSLLSIFGQARSPDLGSDATYC